jgi:hypothetical protein
MKTKAIAAPVGAMVLALALAGCGEKYPPNIEMNFLDGCEMKASATACSCLLGWFEDNRSLTQFLADEDYVRTGTMPTDLATAIQYCRGGY